MIAIKNAHYLLFVLQSKQGLTFIASTTPVMDLYVDADFAGFWAFEHDQEPVSVRSRTGYMITLSGCPIHWSSKLQTEISLYTLEAENIALAQAMREFVPT